MFTEATAVATRGDYVPINDFGWFVPAGDDLFHRNDWLHGFEGRDLRGGGGWRFDRSRYLRDFPRDFVNPLALQIHVRNCRAGITRVHFAGEAMQHASLVLVPVRRGTFFPLAQLHPAAVGQ